MTIDDSQFTPWASLAGGLLIGISTTLFLLGVGRIAGIAGIVAGALQSLARGTVQGQGVRIAFVAGLLLAPTLWKLGGPPPVATAVTGIGGLLLAGLLVGVGVRMANGCTSGHGVCGLSRLALRSMDIPTGQRIDARLVVGGLLFGAGWGIAGFCPGPAVTALGAGFMPAAWFVAAMLAGMWLHDRFIAGAVASLGSDAVKT